MGKGRKGITALLVVASLWITLGNTPSTLASTPPVRVPVVAAEASRPQKAAEAPKPETRETQAPTRTLRRLKGSEMSVPLVKKARELIVEHHKKPFGTEIEFELGGKRYVGRIEQHYHPPGGELHPWGYHPGCSLFAVETGS